VSRRPKTAALHGELVIRCPRRHVLGAFVLQPNGRDIYRLDAPLADGAPRPLVPMNVGEKQTFRCPACRHAGRLPDYQLSWDTLTGALKEAVADTQQNSHVLTIGGPTLC
jgi:hypothetical protein